MIRVVLDTNILVSALLTSQGVPAQVLSVCLAEPDLQLCVSSEIYAEYEEVLRRPKFKRSSDEIEKVLAAIRHSALWVTPSMAVHVCLDADDDVFLECAQEADAHFLVTGNTRHFPAAWKQTRIVTARQALDAVL